MALKDWKLTQKVRFYNRYEDYYVNQKNGDTLVINKATEFTQSKSGYSVFLLYSKDRFHKYFKTLESANKFVKHYMNKN
jgi:hypothetical protein